MCGIFGFALKKPISMKTVFKVLAKLEANQLPGETQPIGGYGAGVAVMLPDGDIISEKVGKEADSPIAQLSELVMPKLKDAQVLIGHVRFPNSKFMGTVKFKEAAQPYVEHFKAQLTVVSAHDGFVENYDALKAKSQRHVFESEKIGFVDSEVVPHYFGELLYEQEDADAAAFELFDSLKGSNTAALLQVDEEDAFLHLVHRGKTSGLTVWANDKNEVIFCSRSDPVEDELESFLLKGKFYVKVTIKSQENAGLKLTFPALFQ